MPIGPTPAPLGQVLHIARQIGDSISASFNAMDQAASPLRIIMQRLSEEVVKNADSMKLFLQGVGQIAPAMKKASVSTKQLAKSGAKGFGLGLLSGFVEKLPIVGNVLKPIMGVLTQDKKIKKSADSSAGMFNAMKGAGTSAALGIVGFLEKIGVIGMVLKPFEPILKIIGGLLKTFIAPIIIAVTKALQPLYKWLMGLMPIFQELGEKLAPIIAKIFSVLIEVFMAFAPIIETLLPIIVKLVSMFFENKIIMDLLLIPLKFLAFILKVVVGWLVGHSPGLIPALKSVADIVQMLVEGALAIFVEILEFIGDVMENITETISLVAEIFLAIGQLINDLILGVLESFNSALQILGNIIKALISGAIKILTSVFNFLGKVMKNITKIIQTFIKIIQMANKIIQALINGALNILIAVFKFFGDVMKNVTKILEVIIGAFQWLGNLIKDIILGIINSFVNILNIFKDIIVAILTPLGQFIGLIRDILGMIPGGGGGGGGFLGLQHGGLIKPPGGLYNIAEAGKPEHVTPDDLMEEYFEGLQYALEDKLETLIILQKAKMEAERWRAGWR